MDKIEIWKSRLARASTIGERLKILEDAEQDVLQMIRAKRRELETLETSRAALKDEADKFR